MKYFVRAVMCCAVTSSIYSRNLAPIYSRDIASNAKSSSISEWFKPVDLTWTKLGKQCSQAAFRQSIMASMYLGPLVIIIILLVNAHLAQLAQVRVEPINPDAQHLCLKENEENQIKLFISRAKKGSPQALLLYGPSGTGKSLIPHRVAEDTNFKLLTFTSADINATTIGLGAIQVRNIFTKASKVAKKDGCVLFIDEIDCIGAPRADHGGGPNEAIHRENNRVTQEFFTQLDAAKKIPNLVIIGATNKGLKELDGAFTRRFRESMKMTLPDANAIKKILNVYLQKGLERWAQYKSRIDELVNGIAPTLDGKNLSGAEIKDIVERAVENFEIRLETDPNAIFANELKSAAEVIMQKKIDSTMRNQGLFFRQSY